MAEIDAYLTIEKPSEGVVREKMSRFLAFAFPVVSVDEAKSKVKELANCYHDARHVCWAYMIGAKRDIYLSSDNGEPSGTAGKPILGQINSMGLTDIVVIVVRYFGGIKLGTSGLIVAYREAAREALESARVVKVHVKEMVSFTFPYLAMNDVMKALKQPVPIVGADGRGGDAELKILEQEFDNSCRMKISLRAGAAENMRRRLENISGVCMSD